MESALLALLRLVARRVELADLDLDLTLELALGIHHDLVMVRELALEVALRSRRCCTFSTTLGSWSVVVVEVLWGGVA